jgi:hypothetical protein
MTKPGTDSLWVVIEIQGGIPVDLKAFREKTSASKYEEERRAKLNLEEDETAIFQVSLLDYSSYQVIIDRSLI